MLKGLHETQYEGTLDSACLGCESWLLYLLVVTCPFYASAAAAAKSLQSCPTLCDPVDGSPPGSPTPGILQARTLEWVAISFSNAWKWKVKVKSLSHVRLLATLWTTAYQAPPSMDFQARVLEWGAIAFSVLYLSILICKKEIRQLPVHTVLRFSVNIPQRS